MTPKRLPVWVVLFSFACFGLNLAWAPLRTVLGFPLLYVLPDTIPMDNILFANSVLWALVFAAIMIFFMRKR
jgi:hypothetical protein